MTRPTPQSTDQDQSRKPHVRPVFRVLATLVAALFLIVPIHVAMTWWAGNTRPDVSVFGNVVEVFAFAILAAVFIAVALTGRVPGWLFRLWVRIS